MPETARLFLAVWPPPAVCDALAAHQRLWQWPEAARTTPPERLHLTLHFIGAVPAARIDALTLGLRTRFAPFELTLAQPEVWPGGIAVLRPQQAPAALQALHAQLARKLHELALPVDARPWRPHVTLARKAQGARRPASNAGIVWPARAGYALVRSLPGGSGYQALQSFG